MTWNLLLLLATSMAWASGYLFIRAADHGLPPITAAAAMAVIGAGVMLPLVSLGLRRPLWRVLRQRPWVPLIMALSAIALPNLAVVAAEDHISPDMASLVGTTVPILTLLLTIFVTRQTPYSHGKLLGILVAVCGLVVFVGWRGLLQDNSEIDGILLMMSGGLIFALNGIFASYETEGLDEYALATWTLTFGAVALVALALIFEEPLAQAPNPGSLWALVGEGVIGMGLAYVGYYLLVARAGPYFASLYAFLVPILGVLAAALLFGDSITGEHVAGLTLTLAGLGLMFRRQASAPAARSVVVAETD